MTTDQNEFLVGCEFFNEKDEKKKLNFFTKDLDQAKDVIKELVEQGLEIEQISLYAIKRIPLNIKVENNYVN